MYANAHTRVSGGVLTPPPVNTQVFYVYAYVNMYIYVCVCKYA